MAVPLNLTGVLNKLGEVAESVRDFNPIDAVFGHWIAVSSSNLEAYRYNEHTKELQVRFHGGRIYSYAGVPQNIVDEFASAPSKGHYLNASIKHQYAAQRAS